MKEVPIVAVSSGKKNLAAGTGLACIGKSLAVSPALCRTSLYKAENRGHTTNNLGAEARMEPPWE
jgi:hypothetical protein